MKRIYDDPNHPHYGPVRRLWVILAQLDLLSSAEAMTELHGKTWDKTLAMLLGSARLNEPEAQRRLLYTILKEC